MPNNKILKQSFANNGDGFGLAYKFNGQQPHIKKGAMTFKAIKRMLKSLPDLTNAEVILHFRLATKGHIYEGNCHPFPLSRKPEHLTAVEIESRMAIAHNGIIYSSTSTYNKGITCYGTDENGKWVEKPTFSDALSDTQEFIRDYLVDIGDAIFNAGVRRLIEDDTMSKFAILTTKGILFIGDFIHEKGLYFSNDSYKKSNYYVPDKSKWPKGGSHDPSTPIPETRKRGDLFVCDLCDAPVSIVNLRDKQWLCQGCQGCFDALQKDTSWQDGI